MQADVARSGETTTVTAVFQASGLPTGTSVDPATVTASLDGTTVPATAAPVGTTPAVTRVAVLAMDTSGSMKGAGLTGAKTAAGTFLAEVPADVKVGLVTFADQALVKVAPTTDRAAVRAAVNGLTAAGGTALYDGTVLAVRTVGTTGVRNVVLLSDGAEDGSSSTTLQEAVTAVRTSKATLDAVSFGTTPQQVAALQALATAGGGSVITTTEADQLAAAFAASAQTISNQLQVTVEVPPEQADAGSLTISAVAGGATISDTVFVPLKGAPSASTSAAAPADYGPVAVGTTWLADLSQAWLWAAFAALFLGLAALFVVALSTVSERRTPGVRRRMSIYTLTGRGPVKEEETTTALGSTQVARSAVDFAGRVVQRRDMEGALAHELEKAAVPLRPAEWAVIHLLIAIGAALLLLLLSGGALLPALIGLAAGVLLPFAYLRRRSENRRKAFNAQLPDTLQLMAGSLQAGYSMPQAVDTVVREGSQPIAAEFNRALVETRLGVPLEDALDGVAERMDSVDFGWVVMAIRIQREVGGNLAEVLSNVAATLRERERLRRQVRALSAEGRLSAWILGLLPVFFALYLLLVRRSYVEPLYTTTLGWLMIGGTLLLMLVGVVWLRRVVKVEV
ncbi:MAG: type II secretion system F family protein [Actinomycetia bacterium]|nr:type II secretion system F family protein [Actinomycetes bacterium]